MIRVKAAIAALLVATAGAREASAWPADLSQKIAKDAVKLLPKSLAELFKDHENEIFGEGRSTQMSSLSLVYADLPKGRLTEKTKDAIATEIATRQKALHGADFKAAVIALGATYRLAVDLADPAVGEGLGSDAKGRAIRREFYAFVDDNLGKIPVVLVEPASLRLKPEAVPGYLERVAARTPAQSALLRVEGQEGGRVMKAGSIDFRSPVFAVASTAYSRSVSAVAATWIAIWRASGGDMQRQKPPRIINPRP